MSRPKALCALCGHEAHNMDCFDGDPYCECHPSGASEPTFEYACQVHETAWKLDGGWRVVGGGASTLWSAREDYAAWKALGRAVRIVCREVRPWVATDQTMSPASAPHSASSPALPTGDKIENGPEHG